LSLDSSYCHHYWKEFKLTQLQPAMKATQLMLISNGSLKSFQAIVKCGQITRLTVSHCNMYHKQIHKTQTKKTKKQTFKDITITTFCTIFTILLLAPTFTLQWWKHSDARKVTMCLEGSNGSLLLGLRLTSSTGYLPSKLETSTGPHSR